jgi:putative ABC transport system permease protein
MSLLSRFTNLFRDDQLGRDIDREQSFHLRERVEELMSQGMPEADAIALARKQFGNRTYTGEDTRSANVIAWLDSVLGDVRYALRALGRSPVFTTVAVLSLALGIGANTAIYSLIDAVLLRQLPVPKPEQLFQVTTSDESDDGYFTNPLWEEVRNRQSGFTSIAAFSETSLNASDGGEVRRLRGLWASGDYFRLFGMEPAVGRLFSRADDVRGCPGMAVLGYGFWQNEYAGRRDIVGQSISISGKPLQIIGVANKGFSGPEVGRDVQLYLPLCTEAVVNTRSALDRRSNWWLRVIGRGDETLTAAQIKARMKTIAPEAYAATVPEDWAAEHKASFLQRTLSAAPAAMGMSSVRDRYATALKVLMGAVALVLLIACANVANLLLARAAARSREVAIRLAIGAARRRLVRQLLTESAVLALLGAAGGLVLGYWGTQGLVALISTAEDPVVLDLGLNLRVLGFTILIASVTAMIFGLVPAWRGTRIDPQTAMKAHGRGVAEGNSRFTIGKALVAAQVALSLTLLVGAGLLIGSLRNLSTMDPGFTADGVLIARAGFGRTGISNAQIDDTRTRLLDRVRSMPGVRSASASDLTPIGGSSWNDELYVDGFTPTSPQDGMAWFNEITDGYFATMDTRLLAGRDFDATDRPGGMRAAIINAAAAKKFFGDSLPLGKTYRTKRGDRFNEPVTIVGVVEDAKYRSLRETDSYTIYVPASQSEAPGSGFSMEIRTDGDPRAAIPAVRNAIAEIHNRASVEFSLLSDQLAASLRRDRMLALLSGLFGFVALSLSVLGLYGVMAYTVARRRNEIGVRIAMGANGGRVIRMVLGDVARVVVIGVVLGIAGALASGKLVKSFLFGLEPADPVVLGASAALLILVALAAGLIPAMRASRVDPVSALRED